VKPVPFTPPNSPDSGEFIMRGLEGYLILYSLKSFPYSLKKKEKKKSLLNKVL
jgi:hypothetical protein